MADFSLNPAYNARAAAGQVITPGLVDWGGIAQRLYDDAQAPYWRRQDEIQGAAVADPMQSRYVAKPRFVAAMNQQQDPLQQYAESGYVAKPRFIAATAPRSAPVSPTQPAGSIRVAKDQSRLASGPAGWDPTYGYSAIPKTPQALAAIEAAAPTGPMFPLRMPGKGTPFSGNYTASMRFASPNAGAPGSDVIDLTAINPRNPQAMADSQGKPVRVGNNVYYPGGRAPAAPRASGTTQTQQKPTGLFGGLFGGGGGQGILSGLFGGAPASRPSAITAPGGGGAFVSSVSSQPASSPLSGVGGENSLLPAALNSERWRTGY